MVDADQHQVLLPGQPVAAGGNRSGIGGKTAAVDVKEHRAFPCKIRRQDIEDQAVFPLFFL